MKILEFEKKIWWIIKYYKNMFKRCTKTRYNLMFVRRSTKSNYIFIQPIILFSKNSCLRFEVLGLQTLEEASLFCWALGPSPTHQTIQILWESLFHCAHVPCPPHPTTSQLLNFADLFLPWWRNSIMQHNWFDIPFFVDCCICLY